MKHSQNMVFLWNLWRQTIGFLVFRISSLAECERLPRGGISCGLSNRIFRYQIWFLFSCFLLILISFLFICNSSLLRRVAFIYSLHIHDSPSVGITLVILTLIRSSSFSLLYSSTNRKRICVLNGALVIIWDLFGSLKQNGVLTLKNSAC